MVIKVYVSLTSGNVLMRIQQDYIKRIFDTKRIDYEEVDIASPNRTDCKRFMQQQVRQQNKHNNGQPTSDENEHQPQKPSDQPQDADALTAEPVLPPQLFHGDTYRGDFEGFFAAVETETVYGYLGLSVPPHEVEFQRLQEAQQHQEQHQQQEQ
jgi:hypothetical protein